MKSGFSAKFEYQLGRMFLSRGADRVPEATAIAVRQLLPQLAALRPADPGLMDSGGCVTIFWSDFVVALQLIVDEAFWGVSKPVVLVGSSSDFQPCVAVFQAVVN